MRDCEALKENSVVWEKNEEEAQGYHSCLFIDF